MVKLKLPANNKKNDLTRCGRRLYKGSHSIRDVQCKSNTVIKKDAVRKQNIHLNVGYI